MSEEYNKEIEKTAEIVMQSPTLLKNILRNYDKLVKERSNTSNLELPYWCYGFCCAEPENEKEIIKAIAEFSANATNGKNGG